MSIRDFLSRQKKGYESRVEQRRARRITRLEHKAKVSEQRIKDLQHVRALKTKIAMEKELRSKVVPSKLQRFGTISKKIAGGTVRGTRVLVKAGSKYSNLHKPQTRRKRTRIRGLNIGGDDFGIDDYSLFD